MLRLGTKVKKDNKYGVVTQKIDNLIYQVFWENEQTTVESELDLEIFNYKYLVTKSDN